MNKKTVKDIDLKNKTVIMRVDFNVPLDENQKVSNNLRIRAALPTIQYVLEQKSKLILMSHLGRPKGKVVETMRMTPVGKELATLLNQDIATCNDCIGEDVKKTVSQMNAGDIVLLENLRFHGEEEKNDAQFAKQLSELAEIYVNDAFGTAHRAHASTEGITQFLPAVSGFLMEKELKYLDQALSKPEKPYVAIVGGAKVSTKISVLENLLTKVTGLIIGGGMTYTFSKAQGYTIGNSLVEEDHIDTAKHLLAKAREMGVNLIIPMDHIVADKFENDADTKVVEGDIPDGYMGMDVGPKTLELIKTELKKSKTVLWNGPLGVFEMSNFAKATFEVAKLLAEIDAVSVVGGGDSASAIKKSGVSQDKITHISTGGGASVEFIEGKKLPGIEALNDK